MGFVCLCVCFPFCCTTPNSDVALNMMMVSLWMKRKKKMPSASLLLLLIKHSHTTFDRYSGVQVGKSNIRQTKLGSGMQMPAENVNKIRLPVQGREARQDYDLLPGGVFPYVVLFLSLRLDILR